MPAAIQKRPPPSTAMVKTTIVGGDSGVNQAQSRLIAGVDQLEGAHQERSKATATLTAGANTVTHGLGRTPTACHVTPTTADATFAYALTSADDKQAVITTVGGTQTDAVLEFS